MKRGFIFLNFIIVVLLYFSCLQENVPTTTTNYYKLTITVEPADSGTVTVSPIADKYKEGTEVTLTCVPKPNTEYYFKEWGGKNGSEVVLNKIKMNGDKSITAKFDLYVPQIPSGTNVKNSKWDNAIVYFVITDRFHNGDVANDTSYGREKDTTTAGHFYGGDLKGLTQKINAGYFNDLSIDAIWITSPLEQVHGWVPGGNNAFKHYAYHGYYHLDWTKLDANMGTEQDLRDFVDTAHSKGIRVVFDVVMNHPGYATIKDLAEFGPATVLNPGYENATVSNYHNYINYSHPDWPNWWGPKWIRAGLPGYTTGSGDLLGGLNYLPDMKTESTEINIGLPIFYANKPDTSADVSHGNTVRTYLVRWITDWVERYGIDGFRCDTVKHVENASWVALKNAATLKFETWKTNNPTKKIDDERFWMTGEVWGHGVNKSNYFTDASFDSLINFGFQSAVSNALTNILSIDSTYSNYANTINNTPSFNVLSYISSHDTKLFFSDYASLAPEKQKLAGTLLLLCPGAVQVFYGDESGRKNGTYPVGNDAQQKTRSKMVFSGDPDFNSDILSHWQKLTKFRKKHKAIGMGNHVKLSLLMPYKFLRIKDTDKVVCVIGATGSTEVNVSGIWSDGTSLRDFYTGNTASVTGGKVTFTAHANGVILIEENN